MDEIPPSLLQQTLFVTLGLGAIIALSAILWDRLNKQILSLSATDPSKALPPDLDFLLTHNPQCVWSQKHILVLVNPFGGGGKAFKTWKSLVEPTLKRLEVQYTLIETQRAGHAGDIAKSQDWSKVAGCMIISGDGMLHEFLNGLLERYKGSVDALRREGVALAIVPGGTMNGFASSLGTPNALKACMRLASPDAQVRDLDAYTVKCKGKIYVDVHCVSAGIVADHDELVERELRGKVPHWMRPIIAPIVVIGRKRAYPAKVYLKPLPVIEEEMSKYGLRNYGKLEADDTGRPGWRMISGKFVFFTVINTEMASFDMIFAPGAKPDDGALYAMVIREGVSRLDMIKLFLSFESGSHIKHPAMEIYKVSQAEYRPVAGDGPLGSMNVSGEELPYSDLDIAVQPKLLKCLY